MCLRKADPNLDLLLWRNKNGKDRERERGGGGGGISLRHVEKFMILL